MATATDSGRPQSLIAASSVNAPGGGTTIASLVAPPAGWYELDFQWTITGAVETLPNNIRLTVSGTTYRFASGAGVGAVYRMRIGRIWSDGTDISLKANAAATASTVYTATLVATQDVS